MASLGASNNLHHTDRQVYDIRNTGGRRAVNWYRAMPTPANVPDSTNPADQLTSYATGEIAANGAAISEKASGTGEQGEYKGIGIPSPNYGAAPRTAWRSLFCAVLRQSAAFPAWLQRPAKHEFRA